MIKEFYEVLVRNKENFKLVRSVGSVWPVGSDGSVGWLGWLGQLGQLGLWVGCIGGLGYSSQSVYVGNIYHHNLRLL
jgi:hypothetical protein